MVLMLWGLVCFFKVASHNCVLDPMAMNHNNFIIDETRVQHGSFILVTESFLNMCNSKNALLIG